MAFEELKNDLSDSQEAGREFIESSVKFYELKIFRFVMRAIIALTVVLFLGTLGLLAVLFLSMAAAVSIGSHLDNYTYGFLIVGIFYVALGILGYALRKRLEGPVLSNFSKYFFEDK